MNNRAIVVVLLLLVAPAAAQSITAVKVAEGLGKACWVGMAPMDDTRLFVIHRRKGITIVKDGNRLPDPFLDLSAEVSTNTQGIMGMAFHPEYADNGKFYVIYTDSNQVSHVAQYLVSIDPDLADPDSRVQILGPEPQPAVVHNWNFVEFGPDDKLYIGTGDGVLSSDNTSSNSQDLGTIFGKVLRLDIDLPPPYIPPDNPFVGVKGAREEIWFYGVRQPWRMTFDALTGDIFLGDVGSHEREEIDFVPASSGGGANFGWRCLEGSDCNNFQGCLDCDDPRFVPPIYEYHSHDEGMCAIIGGYVYRGNAIPDLQGAYFFGDHCTGRIFSFRYDGMTMSDFREWTDALEDGGPDRIDELISFGVDNEGELYVIDDDGELWKIVPAPCAVNSYCMPSPNSAGLGALMGSTGSPAVTQNDFTLTTSGAVPQEFGIFYYGPDPVQIPFGNGVRCVAGGVFRLLPPVTIDSSGDASHTMDFTNPPHPNGEIHPGSTWYFQFWYRDPGAGGAGFNFSDGLSVTFCP